MPLRRLLRDRRARRRRAGERDVVDAGVRGERRARLAAEPGDDVERAVGQPAAGRELGDAQQRQARVLGRLDDAGVAGGERAADAAPEDLQRVVPRDDVAGDAVRLAPGEHRVALGIRQRLAVELVAGAAVELEVAGAGDDVGARLRHRLAAVARLEPGELVGVVGDRARQRRELAPLVRRRQPAPRTVERAPAPRGPPRRRPARRRARSRRTACRRTDRASAASRRAPARTKRPPMKCCAGVRTAARRGRSAARQRRSAGSARRTALRAGGPSLLRRELVRQRGLVDARLVGDAVARRPLRHLEMQRDEPGVVDRELGRALQVRLALDVVDGLQRVLGQRVDLAVRVAARGSRCRSPSRG